MTAELLAGKSIAGAVPPPPLLPRPFVQYTFGEPRTGNQPFASAVASAEAAYTAGAHTWRVVNKKDIVPHLPLEDTFGAYLHIHICFPFSVSVSFSFSPFFTRWH